MVNSENENKSKKRKILIFEDGHALANDLLKKWIGIAEEAVARRNRFTVALPGGRSPMEFYCRLSAFEDFGLWQRTHIFLGDERFVPLDDDNSNFKMIRKNLLDYVNIPPENIHPIHTDQKNVDLSAEQYKNELAGFFEFKENKAPCFDLILLGVGSDGHTASLFPDDGRIDDPGGVVLPVSLPHLKEDRISLALPVINNARNVIAIVLGASKADILKEIIDGQSTTPAAKVAPAAGRMIYLLDKEAARKLSYRDSYSHEGQAVAYESGI
jgi:6-phosphogluconolactonase